MQKLRPWASTSPVAPLTRRAWRTRRGTFIWSAEAVPHRTDDLEALWASLPADAEITVVMEPTRNAWVPLASWFRRQGARVVMVPPEQSADLRDYYSKHTKSDRLDSRTPRPAAAPPPGGSSRRRGLGPAEPMRRATKLRSSLVKRRSEDRFSARCLARVLGSCLAWALRRFKLVTRAALLGRRLCRSPCAAPSRDRPVCPASSSATPAAPGARTRRRLLGRRTRPSSCGTTSWTYGELAEDIAIEARLALPLTDEIHELDQRIEVMLSGADPASILTSVPGVGDGQRRPDPCTTRGSEPLPLPRWRARLSAGSCPRLNASGVHGRHGGPTKSGDALAARSAFQLAPTRRERSIPPSPRAITD